MTEHEDSRPRPSSMVEYRGIAYSLEVMIKKLRREGKLFPYDPQSGASPSEDTGLYASLLEEMKAHPDRYSVSSDNPDNWPCTCCDSLKSIWGPGDWWPWVYLMGACLCMPCYYKLLDAGVEPVPWERGVGGVQTVRDGVRIAPEPDGQDSGSDEIERLIGIPVSPEEVCWANLGSLSLFGKPLGDLIEDFGNAGKVLPKSIFHQLVERGKGEVSEPRNSGPTESGSSPAGPDDVGSPTTRQGGLASHEAWSDDVPKLERPIPDLQLT